MIIEFALFPGRTTEMWPAKKQTLRTDTFEIISKNLWLSEIVCVITCLARSSLT